MHFQDFLLKELSRRRSTNSQYSLRAFARSLDLSPSQVSNLLNGRRRLTFSVAEQISDRLALDPKKAEELRREVHAYKPPMSASRHRENLLLSRQQFQMVAEWEHYALLALANVKPNRFDELWIARRLQIGVARAREVRNRLENLGYLKKSGNGFVQNVPRLETTQDIPTAAIKTYHSNNLDKARESLFGDPVELRYFGSSTFAIDPADLPKFKKILRSTREKLERIADKRKKKRVYHFSVQLFPIDKGEENVSEIL